MFFHSLTNQKVLNWMILNCPKNIVYYLSLNVVPFMLRLAERIPHALVTYVRYRLVCRSPYRSPCPPRTIDVYVLIATR